MKCVIGLLTLIVCIASPFGFAQQPKLTRELKSETIEALADLVRERYAHKDVGEKLHALLKNNLTRGKYDSILVPDEFSNAVTDDLRSLNSDKHLALNYSPRPAATQAGTNTAASTAPQITPEEQARRASEFNRLMNFGFKNVRFLNGNVGYLRFDYFDAFLDYSAPVVDASMGFLKNADAIIIDLRYNGGGSPQMVNYIAGFFFEERTLSGTSYDRLTDTTSKNFIEPQPSQKRISNVDLFILTSPATVSAAEGLAYDLKYLKKAMVIGETSAGAANPGRTTRVNDLFVAFIPNRHGMNVVTGTNWEGTGVPVDLVVPAQDALRKANIEALRRLQQNTTSSFKKQRLGKYITFLEKTYPENVLPRRVLLQYVGNYQGGRTVTLINGELHYTRAGEAGGKMYSISPDTFMLAEGDVTISFKRDGKDKVSSIESQWSLSDTPATAQRLN
ncbi:MAG: S41 family peptidase [Pyrinomonadaceae bacterium]